MEKALLSVQYCTHHHAQLVKEILEKSADDYKNLGIDVYYYDSSSDTKTKEVVQEYIDRGYDNLYYVPVPGMELYEKIENIFEGKGLQKEYSYIWPSKDRTSLYKSALEDVLQAARDEYDVIHISSAHGTRDVYNDAIGFYIEHGGMTTSVNTTIYSMKTLLAGFDKEKEALSEHRCYFYFNHYYHLFNRLSKLESPRIKIVDITDRITMLFDESREESFGIFEIWEDSWMEINDLLPAFYDEYKDIAIKATASYPWIISNRERLIYFHEKGILTEEKLPLVLPNWNRISYIPSAVLIKIVKGEYDRKYDLSQLCGYSSLIDLLIEMCGYIEEDKVAQNQIPIDDIVVSAVHDLKEKKNEDKEQNLLIEVLNNIGNELRNQAMTKDAIVHHLQQIIACLI